MILPFHMGVSKLILDLYERFPFESLIVFESQVAYDSSEFLEWIQCTISMITLPREVSFHLNNGGKQVDCCVFLSCGHGSFVGWSYFSFLPSSLGNT
jgi:hypothetical protein